MNPQLKKLLIKFEEERVDSLLITSDINISYLSDFASRDSWALITPKKRIYITDFRYILEAKSHLKDFLIHKINGSIFEAVARLAKTLKLKSVCFEAKNISFAEFKKIKSCLQKERVQFIPTYDFVEDLRQIKTLQEIKKIKKAVEVTAGAFGFIKRYLKPGVKESTVAAALDNFIKAKGGRFSFDPIIASDANASFPHAKITDKIIRNNETVIVDIGVDLAGYKSDLTRTFFLGRIPLSLRRIYSIVLEAQTKAIQKIKADVKACNIDRCARDVIVKNKLGQFFGHTLGHGIGLEVHEAPSISSKNNTLLKDGMVITIEPAVYIPNKYGIRIEDMILVKQGGAEILSGAINK